MGAIAIRIATENDLDALGRITVESAEFHRRIDPLYYAVPSPPHAIERIRRFMAEERRTILVAADEDATLGFVILTDLPEPDLGGMVRRPLRGIEVGIAVAEAHRDRGVGRLLMRAAEAHARQRGAELLELSVNAGNERAIHLYASEGYRTVGHVMAKWLEQPA